MAGRLAQMVLDHGVEAFVAARSENAAVLDTPAPKRTARDIRAHLKNLERRQDAIVSRWRSGELGANGAVEDLNFIEACRSKAYAELAKLRA